MSALTQNGRMVQGKAYICRMQSPLCCNDVKILLFQAKILEYLIYLRNELRLISPSGLIREEGGVPQKKFGP